MKLIIDKNPITYEDVEPLDFPIVYNTGVIAERLLHTQYNSILQYHFIRLLIDAINASIGTCHCFDTEPYTIGDTCNPDCTAIPALRDVIDYMDRNVAEYRDAIYRDFASLIKLIQLGCDNSCETFIPKDFTELELPRLICPCPSTALDHVLPRDNVEELVQYVLEITEYLDYFYETNPIIENMQYFEQIKAINEQNIDLFPKEINVSGYYSDADGGEGTYYLDKNDTTSIDDTGIVYINKGHRYKRPVKQEVSIAWFGAGVGNDDTAILARILPYKTLFFNYRLYNITLPTSLELEIDDCVNWYGDNAVVNIFLESDVDYVFGIRLLQNIYSIRFSGIVFNVFGNANSLFGINKTFKVELFLFDCKVENVDIGLTPVQYHKPSDTTCNSYLEFEKLPIIPDIHGTDDPNTLCNFKYTNSITTTDNFVLLNGYQEITGDKNFTQELKTNTDTNLALLKSDISSTKIDEIISSLLAQAKTYYQGLSTYATMPIGSYYIQLADLGYWNADGTYDSTHNGPMKERFNEMQMPERMFPATKWQRVAVTTDHYLASYNKKYTLLNSSGLVNDVIKYDVDNSRKDGIKSDNGPSHMAIEYRPRSRRCIIWKRIK